MIVYTYIHIYIYVHKKKSERQRIRKVLQDPASSAREFRDEALEILQIAISTFNSVCFKLTHEKKKKKEKEYLNITRRQNNKESTKNGLAKTTKNPLQNNK